MANNKPEFQDVYKEFHRKIGGYLGRMVGAGEAEDLTQEVFMKIDKGLGEFEGQSSISTWIYRIATNAALDRIKSRTFRESKEKVSLNAALEDSEARCSGVPAMETSLSAEREAVRNEMNECIREFVDRLPADYRTVIILSEIKDLKNQEVADILGLSLDAVKIRLHRARARLKAEFEAGCEFYHDEDGELACDRKKRPKEPQ
ncbi:MAG: RNA polymerase sigma factor [Planctomycetota bacterium]|jgi:RNA polymerase sigma-70 factor (ECF subfamily)